MPARSPSNTLGAVEHINLGKMSPARLVNNQEAIELHVAFTQPIRLVPVIHGFGQAIIPLLGVSILVFWIHMDRMMVCIAMDPADKNVRQMIQIASSSGQIAVFLRSADNSSIEFTRKFILSPQIGLVMEQSQSLQSSEKFHQAHHMFVLLGMAKQLAQAQSSPEHPIKQAIDALLASSS